MREKGKPDNIIPFSEMDCHQQGGYFFYYDRKLKQLADLYTDPADILQVRTDEMVKVDPSGMARKYGIAVQAVPQRDCDCRADAEVLKRKLNGEALMVSILDRSFKIDERGLVPVKDTGTGILLPNWQNGFYMSKFSFFYDTVTGKQVSLPADMITPPKDVLLVTISNPLSTLIGLRRLKMNYRGDVEVLKNCRLQINFETRVFPLSESIVPEIIKENRAEMVKGSARPVSQKYPSLKGGKRRIHSKGY